MVMSWNKMQELSVLMLPFMHRAPSMFCFPVPTTEMCACVLSYFSHVRLLATLWIVALQTHLCTGFFRQEYQSGLPCPPPGDLPHQWIKPCPLCLLDWQMGSFTTSVTHLLTAYCILGMGNRKEAETASDPALLLFVSQSGGYYSL